MDDNNPLEKYYVTYFHRSRFLANRNTNEIIKN